MNCLAASGADIVLIPTIPVQFVLFAGMPKIYPKNFSYPFGLIKCTETFKTAPRKLIVGYSCQMNNGGKTHHAVRFGNPPL